MSPWRVVRDRQSRKNVEPRDQGVPNELEVKPNENVTNAELWEVIRVLSRAVTNHVGQHRGSRKEVVDTLTIWEFLRMHWKGYREFYRGIEEGIWSYACWRHWEVELVAYQLKGVFRTWLDQWNEGRDVDAPPASWTCFDEAFFGALFPHKLKKAKAREFLTIKKAYLSFHKYWWKFT